MITRLLLTAALAMSAAIAVALPTKEQQAVAGVADPENMSYNTISPDGTCGGTTGYTCNHSVFGDCCSTSGHCGVTEAYCGAKCVPEAGFCNIKAKPGAGAAAAALKQQAAIADLVVAATTTTTTSMAPPGHTPWKPTPFRDAYYKPSYVIDNGERAPNQVWN